eukprot:5175192-Pleurochrysis_carterae.AAC.3
MNCSLLVTSRRPALASRIYTISSSVHGGALLVAAAGDKGARTRFARGFRFGRSRSSRRST